jgi:hypothetical protein
MMTGNNFKAFKTAADMQVKNVSAAGAAAGKKKRGRTLLRPLHNNT